MDVSRKHNVNAADCPSRAVLEHVTSRWGVLVLALLRDEGSLRFSELRRAISGISEKMLAQTLQTLERDGFVHRAAQPVIPPRVDYSLTGLGQEAAAHVWGLARWVEERLPQVQEGQQRYDLARAAATR
ncbi:MULTISPECIES: winged helix-turn-helix transcriptional regulator [Streptomyces]|jgi:DNA-binding HxlR family transcriptional regulator|uniref:winged helix-turn-helix transcriptional regulator n=1 Tax=Streptomyces TaxID=1883 RepID=UPI0019069927|nr:MULTISPECIES: helix-turn-helix domain-containing protein [unclassified Streptomyces]MCU4746065.1 helix-turn-helix transcriptional regulator [Streptomyces sp. G-5]QQN76394.1 helix-turn-helix transcriptional regulator [Streptomyces sp. XC 2026]